jgi:hypothetical protein
MTSVRGGTDRAGEVQHDHQHEQRDEHPDDDAGRPVGLRLRL